MSTIPLRDEKSIPGLLSAMEIELEQCGRDFPDLIPRSRNAVRIVKTFLDHLKSIILASDFGSKQEEILFFKEIKPRFVSELIFHCRVHQVQSSRPLFRNRIQEEYLARQLTRIEYFLQKHRAFYHYMQSNQQNQDEEYFLRGVEDTDLSMDDYFFNADTRFSTGYDYLVSCFKAYERLGSWINEEMQGLPHPYFPQPARPVKLVWTGSKSALIELIYGLQTCGVFNNGAADIKQIATSFEQLYRVDLGGYYRTFQELRMRKKNRTAFLDHVKERLNIRMDELEHQEDLRLKSHVQLRKP
ncbi:MAG TPA: RteC domain-containing protein [Chitinophagaceae bacterium]|nr:RteC domain-containing protein [Chitinophagaceae bacterium]